MDSPKFTGASLTLYLVKIDSVLQTALDRKHDNLATNPAASPLIYDVFEVRSGSAEPFLHLTETIEAAIYAHCSFNESLLQMWKPRIYYTRQKQGRTIRVRTIQAACSAPNVTAMTWHYLMPLPQAQKFAFSDKLLVRS